jgi:hypothetical protein
VVRILPVALIVMGAGLHFWHCEWEISETTKYPETTACQRVIFADHRRGFERRGWLPNHMVLLARPGMNREEATLYGAVLPAVLIGGAFVIWHFQKDPHRPEASYA